jgi:ribosomal protein S18 acetylase RimI-like enzyme
VASSLRSYRPGDLRAAFELARRAVSRPEEQVGKPLWRSLADAERDMSHSESLAELMVVAEEDGRAIAFGGVEPDTFPNVFGPLVAPEARGRQLGGAVLDAAMERARAHGVPSLVATVGRRNARGRLMLERHGFIPREGLTAIFRLFPTEHVPLALGSAEVTVRRGTAADADAVFALYREGFPHGTRTPEVWRRWLERGEVTLVESGGAPVAFTHVQSGWLTHLGVTESTRGRGLGELAMSEALSEHWRVHPGDVLHLTVEAENTAAIRLYRRLGFAPWLLLEAFDRAL